MEDILELLKKYEIEENNGWDCYLTIFSDGTGHVGDEQDGEPHFYFDNIHHLKKQLEDRLQL